jgi:peptidoglycan/LPS O-acetylase OafA/YrhL
MGPLDALNHLLNLFLPAFALGALAAGATKLVWRRELAAVPWRRLAVPAAVACALVALAGLVLSGRDGKMATYGAMVLACSLTLWWRGFGPGRR